MHLSRTSFRALAALALTCAAGFAQAQAYISGSISGQLAPGVYGQVNIGNAAPPALLYGQPMWGGPVVQQAPPVYMWVPPGHAKNWRRYCGRYNACGRPTYFLRDAPPQWRGGPAPRQERHWDRDDRDDRRHWDRDDRRDRHEQRGWDRRDREDDQGHGRGRGRGHGRHDD